MQYLIVAFSELCSHDNRIILWVAVDSKREREIDSKRVKERERERE
jgi:hypothetical protein